MSIPDDPLTVRVPKALRGELEAIAKATGSSVSHLVRTALEACYRPDSRKHRQANSLRQVAAKMRRRGR